MKTAIWMIAVALAASGCVPTYSAISGTPIMVEGVGEVYRYQGRANFAHQIAEADQLMAEHCRQANGGRAVIVSHQTRNIGFGGIGQSQSQTIMAGSAMATPGLVTATATGLTTGVGTASVMANQNQEILFRCTR